MIDLLVALLAGLATVAAPCVLPMLPIIFGTSVGQTRRARPLFIALGFSFAFSAAALLFGTFSHALGLSAASLRSAAIALLVIFGSLMIWPRPFEWLSLRFSGALNRANAVADRASSGSGFVLGMSLGVLWTPCAGPVLGSILTLLASNQDLPHAALLLVCYALGAGIPMLGIAYGGQYMSTRVRRFARYTHRVQQAFGVIVILTGAAMYWQYDNLLVSWLSRFYPDSQLGL